jgi:putative acetyltransferase
MLIRQYKSDDLDEIVALFRRSVRELASSDYTDQQIAAWAPETSEPPSWSQRLATELVVVCEIGGRIAGFARLERNGYLDLLYVHPEFARRGVASRLCDYLEEWAVRNRVGRMFTEASVTARPFFECRGFRATREQTALPQGVPISNFTMERTL